MVDANTGRGFSLKDKLFNREKVQYLGGLFAAKDANFDAVVFEEKVMKQLLKLELKERISLIASVLSDHLPTDFPKAARVIETALPAPLDPLKVDDDFGDFIFAPLAVFVENYGMAEQDLPTALNLLEELTKRFSVEFTMRYFLNAWPVETLSKMREWAESDNYHVRRLVSESTRPTLPWGKKIGLDVSDPLPFLEILHADPTRFVTRSVANHLNDISKTRPDLVVGMLAHWRKEKKQDPKELEWMISHSLRTLVKKGDMGALRLLGYRDNPAVDVSNIGITPSASATIGDRLTFEFTLNANKDESLLIDYSVDFVKKNGSTSPKMFKLKKLSMKKGETVTLTKTHRFLKGATTFTHYPGRHQFNLQVNGKMVKNCSFDLED